MPYSHLRLAQQWILAVISEPVRFEMQLSIERTSQVHSLGRCRRVGKRAEARVARRLHCEARNAVERRGDRNVFDNTGENSHLSTLAYARIQDLYSYPVR